LGGGARAPTPKPPIPNPQSPIPNKNLDKNNYLNFNLINILFKFIS